MKMLFNVLIVSFLVQNIQAQEFCFVNNGLKNQETVSFETKGNIVKFGVWEHGNYDTKNAETYLFYGKKTGNKLMITFTRTIPYTIPNKAKEAVWTLEDGVLKIPMYEKNYDTKKFENTITEFTNCEAVKSDDFEENFSKNTPCSCDAYVIDKDKNGLNVREKGDKNAKIIAKIPFNNEGTIVHISSSMGFGWVSVNKAIDVNNKIVLQKSGFAFTQKLGVSVTGYKNGKVDFYAEPSTKSEVVHSLIAGNDVVVLNCKGLWLEVKDVQSNVVGWLRPEDQCANPVTACN